MDDAALAERLRRLGLTLPPPTKAMATYVPCLVVGETAWVSGQVPMIDGQVVNPGLLGAGVTVEEGAHAAQQAALQVLSVLRDALGGSFARLRRLTQVTVFVAATPDFIEHPKVANGASDLFVEVLGEQGKHTRAAIGMASLPLRACVEVTAVASVDP
jgi:enamine deaminase RidA (YjgF/YER057c/UK114 family)